MKSSDEEKSQQITKEKEQVATLMTDRSNIQSELDTK